MLLFARVKPLATRHLLTTCGRQMHSSAARYETVKLAYESYQPPKDKAAKTDAKAIVLCHGLFGSKQNWRSLAKSMAQQRAVPVYALDLRNHGASPHISSMRYDEMADDLIGFFEEHEIRQAALVGHSMGGKAVQSMALSEKLPKDYLSHLVSVDMSPARGPLSKEFAEYVKAMLDIDAAQCTSRHQADEILSKVEPELSIRQFLLTNLHRPSPSQHWTFRIPVKMINEDLEQIGDFPYDDEKGLMKDDRQVRSWDGKTLFVKGAKSKYINRKNIPICDAFFPNAKHVTLDTGHWVQAEQPIEFVKTLANFIKN